MRLPMFSQTTAWTRIPHRHQELEIETDLQVNLFPQHPQAQQSCAKTKARTGSTVLFVIPCRNTTKDGRLHEKENFLVVMLLSASSWGARREMVSKEVWDCDVFRGP